MSGACPVTVAAAPDVNGAANTDARRSTTWSFVVEEAEAPVQGGADRPVPVVEPGPAGQQAQPVGQARLQPVEPEGRQPRRGQLDRQGDPVQLGRRSPRSGAGRRGTATTSPPWRPARRTTPPRRPRRPSSSSDSPGTGNTHSNGTCSRARLVASTVVFGQADSSRSTKAVTPSTRCSQLSSTTSASAPASLATTVSVGDRPSCSPNPKAPATAAPTMAGSVTGTRSTYHAPSA